MTLGTSKVFTITVSNLTSPMNFGEAMNTVKLSENTNTANMITEVLQHIDRYRLTVLEALQRLPVFSELRSQQVRRILRKLERRALIAAAPLHRGVLYWYMLPKGSQRLGLADDRSGPLSEPAKIRAYALLRFCWLSEKPRVRLTRGDIATRLPEFDRPGLPSLYYFEASGSGVLGIARVDAGHRGRWYRIVQTLRDDIDAHLRGPAWRRLITAGRFEFTLLTVFPEKAERIRETLAQHPDVGRAKVQVIALPELLPFITSNI